MPRQVAKTAADGMISPKADRNTRIAAECCASLRHRLERALIQCSLNIVVEAHPKWAETHSLIRYPSPDGRTWSWVDRPPLFSAAGVEAVHRRGFAHCRHVGMDRFDQRSRMPLSARINTAHKQRGEYLCELPKQLLQASWPLAGWRHAATPWASKPLSAALRAPVRRLYWMATFSLARSSARPATWPSVRPIRPNVADLRRLDRGRTKPNRHQTIGATRAGGLFCAIPDQHTVWSGTERRDQTCLRRS